MSQKGRPSLYSDDIAEHICVQLAEGRALVDIVQDEAMPAQSTVYLWLLKHPPFSEMYTRARSWQADTMADRAARMGLDPASITDPQAARVQLDAIKWATARLEPRKYGDKLDLNHGGQENGKPVEVIHRVHVDLG